MGELWEAQGQLWEALAELREALGALWEGLYIQKLPINRPSGRYVRYFDDLEWFLARRGMPGSFFPNFRVPQTPLRACLAHVSGPDLAPRQLLQGRRAG